MVVETLAQPPTGSNGKQSTSMKYDIRKQIRSFGFAWKGIIHGANREQNLRFHLCVALLTIFAGIGFGISRHEWIAVILCIGLVITAELMNSAVERVVDLASPEQHPLAGQAKDLAAGAVLVSAIAAIIVGAFIFLPYLTRFFL